MLAATLTCGTFALAGALSSYSFTSTAAKFRGDNAERMNFMTSLSGGSKGDMGGLDATALDFKAMLHKEREQAKQKQANKSRDATGAPLARYYFVIVFVSSSLSRVGNSPETDACAMM